MKIINFHIFVSSQNRCIHLCSDTPTQGTDHRGNFIWLRSLILPKTSGLMGCLYRGAHQILWQFHGENMRKSENHPIIHSNWFFSKKNLSRYSHWLAKTVPPFPIWVSWLTSTSRRQAARSSLQLMGSSRRAFPDPTGHMEKWHGKLHGKLCRLDSSPIYIHTYPHWSWIFMDLFNDWTWNHRIWAQTKESQSIFATCGYKGKDPLTIIQGFQGL